MPWLCPACHTPIRHDELEDKPHSGVRYRCPICRLDFVFDEDRNQLVVAPLPEDEAVRPPRKRRG